MMVSPHFGLPAHLVLIAFRISSSCADTLDDGSGGSGCGGGGSWFGVKSFLKSASISSTRSLRSSFSLMSIRVSAGCWRSGCTTCEMLRTSRASGPSAA